MNSTNRYQDTDNYLLEHPISQSSDDQKFQTTEHSILQIENQEEHDHHFLPSVKKFLSQPNPLMNKIQFTPYHPKCYYPRPLGKLPKCLKDFSCIMIEKNNMNSLHQAVHGHQKLKKDVIQLLVNKNKKSAQNKTHLVTLQQFYEHKEPIYQRYTAQQMKLEENKLKLKYFATFVLDIAKVLRKQMKFQQNHHKNMYTQAHVPINHHNSAVTSRPASVTKSGNFTIRQQKATNLQRAIQSQHGSRKSLHSRRIQFDSNFQSGNLFRVYQKQLNQYDLILQNDINTKGNTQWFFFSVRNIPKNTTVKFNIVNMSKCGSLFNIGMKPYVFSMMRYQKRNVGWIREGLKVTYQQSQFHRKQSNKTPYYVLSFQYKSLYEGDIIYFSQSIPYTLTDLSQFLNVRLKDKSLHKLVNIKNVGLTLGSNQVDLLEITNSQFLNRNKKSVWILARQHPGQTTSGFMLEGIIDFLISDSQEAKLLLNNFIFKIVPMVNVDGVIHGNTRAQFIGTDPNRKWQHPHKLHNPILHSIKHYIQRQKDNVEMILDLHSHSRKLGTFFYGNNLSTNTATTRIYPLIVCKNDTRYTFKNCRFNGGSNSAARYALFETLKIPLIYTVQASFYGYQVSDYKIIQYLPKDYKQMGLSLMKSFCDYQLKKNLKSLKILKPIALRQDLQNQMDEQTNNQQCDNESVGSDQDPGEDEYNEKEFKKLITNKDKKKPKNKKKIKQPPLQIKVIKEQVKPLKKIKMNSSESYYKNYFSGRVSALRNCPHQITDTINNYNNFIIKKQTASFGIQVNLKESSGYLSRRQSSSQINSSNGFRNILSERNGQQMISAKLGNLMPSKQMKFSFEPNNLCVIGQKVQQISIYGTTIGIQVSQNKQIFTSRFDSNNNSSVNRKSFSVRQRINSFLQVKQNNFLQRGDCMTKNFFSRK